MPDDQVLTYQDLMNLVESGKDLAARVNLPALLDDILERARRLTDSEGASVLLEDERSGGLYFAAALGGGAATILDQYGESSSQRVPLHSKAGGVFRSGESIIEESLARDHQHFKAVDEKTGSTTMRMVCVAMTVADERTAKRLGVLQIINKRSGPYTERDQVLLEHFAAQAAVAIRNGALFRNLVAHMGFYSDRDPLSIMEELKGPPNSEALTLMFADMRGFTRLCQTIRNEKRICNVLSEFMTMLAEEVLAHEGMVNKKMGDGILALFRPAAGPRKAVECAFSILDRFAAQHVKWARSVPENLDFLDVGMGLVTDEVMLGTIGTGLMRDFTVIGTPVILAAALEKQARGGKRILCDQSTYFAVKDIVDDSVAPFLLDLHKPDQPKFTSYDVYQLMRRKTAAAAPGAAAVTAFLCHASEDKKRVCELRAQLERDGVETWLDEAAIRGGEDWSAAILRALRGCDIVLICMTQHSVRKEGYVQKEIRHALEVADEKPEGRVYVIPVRLEDCDIPPSLRRWQWVDFFAPGGYRLLLESIRAACSGAHAARRTGV